MKIGELRIFIGNLPVLNGMKRSEVSFSLLTELPVQG